MHTVRCGFDGIPTVRFSDVVNPTVRFGAVFRCRKPCGAVRCGFPIYRKSYGAARFGFEESKNPTVRFGAVNRTEPIEKTAP